MKYLVALILLDAYQEQQEQRLDKMRKKLEVLLITVYRTQKVKILYYMDYLWTKRI